MIRSTVTSLIGLILGEGLGALCAFVLFPPTASDNQQRWTTYPTLADVNDMNSGTVFAQQVDAISGFRYWLFYGLLWGGGFGLIAGAIVGASSALWQVARRLPGPQKE